MKTTASGINLAKSVFHLRVDTPPRLTPISAWVLPTESGITASIRNDTTRILQYVFLHSASDKCTTDESLLILNGAAQERLNPFSVLPRNQGERTIIISSNIVTASVDFPQGDTPVLFLGPLVATHSINH